ncbi:MAG TPA: hypothetical protein VIG88_10310 [Lysobacter sp.]
MGLDFTDKQRERLADLGVLPSQVDELRAAFPLILIATGRPAPRNEVRGILSEVSGLAEQLARKLEACEGRIGPAHAHASALMQVAFFERRPDEAGATVGIVLAARLRDLSAAARSAFDSVPSNPARKRSASPTPIKAIADALRRGWVKHHGSRVCRTRYEGEREIREYDAPNSAVAPLMPERFRPSAADGSRGNVFRAVVGICYEACGAGPDPVAAIKAHLRLEAACTREVLAAMEEGINAAGREDRTSPRI